MAVPAGGSALKGARGRIDREARATVARELGHSRAAIASTYLGE